MSLSRKKQRALFFKESAKQQPKHSANVNIDWFEQEQQEELLLPKPQKILEIFWKNKIIKYDKKSIDGFKDFLKTVLFKNDNDGQERIEILFSDALSKKINFDIFCKEILAFGPKYIYAMNGAEKLIPLPPASKIQDLSRSLDENDIHNIKKYMQDKKMSASITLRANSGQLLTPDFPENQSSSAFAMHSIGKVFTGILTLIMVKEGILTENDLNSPIQLDDSVKMQLSPAVHEQLKKVTLHQVMTHRAGLGDYLGNYVRTLTEGKVLEMKQVEDFLPFVDRKIFPIGEERYSNAGILLVGLAIKHGYEKKTGKPCDYNEILNKYIIDKAGIKNFTPWRPENGRFNPTDKPAKNIVGCPAGGYWTTAEDLAKFGRWVYETCSTEPVMKKLIEKYGQEFYQPERQLIAHSGGIPSSSAYLSVSLKTGAVIAIMSDQPDMAIALHARIQKNIIADKSLQFTDKEMADSAFGKGSKRAAIELKK